MMNELTLESLAARVADLEKRMDGKPTVIAPTRDWRSVIGISEETDFSRSMQAEMAAIRKVESDASAVGQDR